MENEKLPTYTLAKQDCIPCKIDSQKLSLENISKLLLNLDDKWIINNSGHLYKKYKFNKFMDSLFLANVIGDIAEQQGHHPMLTIQWKSCEVEIWTHRINGLTANDFILAAKIDYEINKGNSNEILSSP